MLAEIELEAPDLVVVAGDVAGAWARELLTRQQRDFLARFAELIRASDYWDAENTANQLLDPPDPGEMEALFERVAADRGERGPARP